MSTIQLQTINWPVFRLGEKAPQQRDGVVYYSSEYEQDTDSELVVSHTLRIVDDSNLPGPTLGRRRLQLKESRAAVFPLRTAVYFLADLVKLAKATTWWIDSSGQVFQHKKSTRAKLTTHKIAQVLPAAGLGCVLQVEGLVTRFKSIARPKPEEQYAALLHFGRVTLLYGFSTTPLKPTWRLV